MAKFGDYSAVTTLADTDVTVFSTSSGTKKITIASIAALIKSKIGITSVVTVLPAQSLTASGGSLTFSSSAIKTTSIVEPYATIFGISPSSMTVTDGKCVITFDAQSAAFDVKLTVRN